VIVTVCRLTAQCATPGAKRMFSLDQQELDQAMASEEQRLENHGVDAVVASAYLKVMPLLWERTAVSNFLLDNPTLRVAMPPLESASEAVQMARRDFQMTTPQMTVLAKLLRGKPTLRGERAA
jgi:hypothetical protein